MKNLLSIVILSISVNSFTFHSTASVLLRVVQGSSGRDQLGKAFCGLAIKTNNLNIAEYFGNKIFGNDWKQVLGGGETEEVIPTDMPKRLVQALEELYKEAQDEKREDVISFMNFCAADKCKPPYASQVDGTPSDVVALGLKEYWKAAFARQYCNEALKSNRSDIAEYLGLYLHGQDWQVKIQQPHPLTDSVIFELQNNSVLSWATKERFLQEVQEQFKKDNREDLEKFIFKNTK